MDTKVEYGVFLDRDRLEHVRGRPSKYRKIINDFMASGAPQAKIGFGDSLTAHNVKNGIKLYIDSHNVPISAHLSGSSVVLVKEEA